MVRTFLAAAVSLVLFVGVGLSADAKKAKAEKGVLKKVDAETGSLVVAVKAKGEVKEKEFKVDDGTKVIVGGGKEKKELAGKEGLKNEAFKEGALVGVMCDEGGKVLAVQVQAGKKDK
jgi:phage/plasmid primase-like uncharacterized protein